MRMSKSEGKLVRDLVPDHIRADGGRPQVETLDGPDLIFALREKLVEEAREVLEAQSHTLTVQELADVTEVIRTLCTRLGINPQELEEAIAAKNDKSGSFSQGLYLKGVATGDRYRVPRN